MNGSAGAVWVNPFVASGCVESLGINAGHGIPYDKAAGKTPNADYSRAAEDQG